MRVTIEEAEAGFEALIDRARSGEEVIILHGGEPAARLVAIHPRPRREFGSMKGEITVGDEFFEPLSDEELAAWDQ